MYKILIILTIMSSFAFAQTIDQQINTIKKAPARQRAQLMNAFKLRLANMNKEERLGAIKIMRSSMSKKHPSKAQHPLRHDKRVPHIQMQNNGEINSYQNMNQNQAGHQIGHQNFNPNGLPPPPSNYMEQPPTNFMERP